MIAKSQTPLRSTAEASDSVGISPFADRPAPSPLNWPLVLIFSLIAFAAYCFRWNQTPYEIADTQGYLEVAHGFAHGHFSQMYGRLPGLPLLFLLVGTGRTYFYATLLLHLACVASIALLLSRLAVRTTVIWAFIFIALLPPYMQNTGYLATESLAEFLLTIGFVGISLYILDNRWLYCFLASLCFLGAEITRPTNLLAPFVLAAVLLVLPRRRLTRAAALLVAIPVLLLGSYFVFSVSHLNYFGISSMAGYQLSNSTVPLYDYIDNPIAREVLAGARDRLIAEKAPPNFAIWRARAALKQRLGFSDAELGHFLLLMNLRLIAHHPRAYLGQTARGLNLYWIPYWTKMIDGDNAIAKLLWYGIQALIVAVFLFEMVVVTGLLVGSYILNRDSGFTGDRWVVFLLAISIIFQIVIVSYAVMGMGDPRYRSVTDLLILFAIAVFGDWAWKMWHTSRLSSGD